MSKLYIIAGPNGAGKTTASYSVLPEILGCKEFVNADEIAKGLSPFNPEKVAIHAGKIMLNRINELLENNKTFAFETTLASKSYLNFIRKAKERNYEIILLFLFLQSTEMAIRRVKIRVDEGGHNIPKDVIIRRYEKGLKNLLSLYIPKVDHWILVDNSFGEFEIISEGVKNNISVKNLILWESLKNKYDER